MFNFFLFFQLDDYISSNFYVIDCSFKLSLSSSFYPFMQAIPIPSSKAVMVEKAFNLAAQKLGFEFVAKKCKY